jgi:uncharacterized protein (DUF58 family)
VIEPTERLLWSLVGAGVVGVMGLAVPAIGAAAPFVLLGLAIFVVADVVLAGSPARVQVVRRLPERAVEGRDVVVDLELTAPFSTTVEVTDTTALLAPTWTTVTVPLRPDITSVVHTRRQARRRGQGGRGRFAIRTFGPLGLVRRRQRRDGVGDDVVVAIDTAAVLQAASRLVRGGDDAGSRRKRAMERGRELESLRDYRRGDDVRLVDWKATARRDVLVVKELVPETRQDVIVVVDSGRQMLGADDHGRARHDEGTAVALLVAAAAIEKGDRAGLCIVDDDVRAMWQPREGRAWLGRLALAVAEAQPAAVETAWQELSALLVRRQKRRALVVIVTDVVDEASARALARGLATLRGRHLMLVVAIDDPGVARLAAADASSSSSAADPLGPWLVPAATHLLGHRRRALAALSATSAVVVDAPAGRAGAMAVDAYLALKAAGRL